MDIQIDGFEDTNRELFLFVAFVNFFRLSLLWILGEKLPNRSTGATYHNAMGDLLDDID